MASSQKKAIRNAEARKIIAENYEEDLRRDGFVCPDDRLLCWYRVLNGEVLNTIIFFSPWPNLPLLMCIGVGVHPLFYEPYYITDVATNDIPWVAGWLQRPIGAFIPYDYKKDILSLLGNAQNVEQCYRYHLENYYLSNRFGDNVIVDEAIYLNDVSVFDECRQAIAGKICTNKEKLASQPQQKSVQQWLEEERKTLYMQNRALTEGGREEYVAFLEHQKRKNLELLQSKYGVVV